MERLVSFGVADVEGEMVLAPLNNSDGRVDARIEVVTQLSCKLTDV